MKRKQAYLRVAAAVAAVVLGALLYFLLPESGSPVLPGLGSQRATGKSADVSKSAKEALSHQEIAGGHREEDTAAFAEGDGMPALALNEPTQSDLLERIGAAMKRLHEIRKVQGIATALIGAFGDDTSLAEACDAMNKLIWQSEESFFLFLELFAAIDGQDMRWVVMQYLSWGGGGVDCKTPFFSRGGVDRLAEMLTSREHDLAMYRVLGIALSSLMHDMRPLEAASDKSTFPLSHESAVLLVKWLQNGFNTPGDEEEELALGIKVSAMEKRIMCNADFRFTLARYICIYPEIRTFFLELLGNERLGRYSKEVAVLPALSALAIDDDDVFRFVLEVLNAKDNPADMTLLTWQVNVVEMFYRNRTASPSNWELRRLEAFYASLNALMNSTGSPDVKAAIGKRLTEDSFWLSANSMEEIAATLTSFEVPWETKTGMLGALRWVAKPLHLLYAEAFRAEDLAKRDTAVSLLYSVAQNESQDEHARAKALQLLMEYYSEYVLKHPASKEERELTRLILAGKADSSQLVRHAVENFEAAFQAKTSGTDDVEGPKEDEEENESSSH